MVRVTAGFVVAALFAACAAPGASAPSEASGSPGASAPPAMTLILPAHLGAPAMPVEVVDQTDTVVAVAPPPDAMEDNEWGFASLPDQRKIAIGWVSSRCDRAARVTLERRDEQDSGVGRILVTIETVAGAAPTLPNGASCDLELGGRTIIVTFPEPADLALFDLEAPDS
jgi:hypothetical protein